MTNVFASSKVSPVLAILALIVAPVVNAEGPNRYLTGSVSFDEASNLYTYNYWVNNASGVASIGQVSLLVDSSGYYVAPDPNHISHTKPAGYEIYLAATGDIENPPYNIVGTMYSWVSLNLRDLIPRGAAQGGFSMSVPFPPTSGKNNNYFLYSFDSREVVDYGHVVAPDFGGRFQVPEPASLGLAACSCMAILSIGRRFANGGAVSRAAWQNVPSRWRRGDESLL